MKSLATTTIEFGGITAEVVRKPIKHVHLSVCPPRGAVRISAPHRAELEAVRLFAASRIKWIRHHQTRYLSQERETPRQYLPRESHYIWGRRCLLAIAEENAPPKVEWNHRSSLLLHVRPSASIAQKHALMSAWYRQQVREVAAPLIEKWQPKMGVQVSRLFVQQMKTRWGSCNTVKKRIRLNSNLAKKHPSCLEYVIVHEMTHLLERTAQ